MKPNTIEFASLGESDNSNNNSSEKSPWEKTGKGTYQDLILKPEYMARRLRFPIGKTWIRLVPNFKISSFGWMLGVFVINYEGGKIVHPRTLRRDRKNAFDIAYSYLKENRPELLYCKANKNGFKLLPDPISVCWTLMEEDGKTLARLYVGSGYDGTRGGVEGLGHQLSRLPHERDEYQQLLANPVDSKEGRLVCVEKTQPNGVKYPSYSLRVGNQPAPMSDYIRKMEEEEFAVLCPLENVIRELSVEEEWQFLAKIVGEDLAQEIRSNIK